MTMIRNFEIQFIVTRLILLKIKVFENLKSLMPLLMRLLKEILKLMKIKQTLNMKIEQLSK